MKTLFALAVFLTAVASAQAAPLLQAERHPGFEMNPESSVFTLDTSGKMTTVIHNFRHNTTKTVVVGQLSKVAVEKIAAKVAAIPADAPLVDPEQGKPMCTDSPSYSSAVFKGREKKEISRSAGCHSFSVENSYEAKELAELAGTLLNLAN